MAELTTTDASTTSSCCSPEAQSSRCEPAAKVACCETSAAGGSCGCSAGQAGHAASAIGSADIRETVREKVTKVEEKYAKATSDSPLKGIKAGDVVRAQ